MKKFKRPPTPSVPIANLVDIAILLIIFYMACSHFITQEAVKLNPPKAADLASLNEPLIQVAVNAQNHIYLQGQMVENTEAVEWGVNAIIKDKLTAEGRTVMFKCDASVNRDVYEPVLEAIAKGGGLIAAIGDNLGKRDKK